MDRTVKSPRLELEVGDDDSLGVGSATAASAREGNGPYLWRTNAVCT